ncbi:MAG: hypothetical protein MET45_28465 [Nostoc sp. LLA-1]|nr:hypothetical protein [Cyanocohniella sp. LLY]
MRYRLWFNLVVISTLATSVLTMLQTPGVSATARTTNETQASCDLPTDFQTQTSVLPHGNRGILVAYSEGMSGEDTLFDFSAAESDAAVTLFGCDCPACLNVLRQLRSSPMMKSGKGHCWDNMEFTASRQKLQEVLTNLEAEEAIELKTRLD